LIQPKTVVTQTVSSVDLAPTLLALLGFDTQALGFDGVNALGPIPDDRKIYFSGWLSQSPIGFVKANQKFIYYPDDKLVSVYDLSTDPLELSPAELPGQQGRKIADCLIAWRDSTFFPLDQKHKGKKILFDTWLCRWKGRVASARYRPNLSRATSGEQSRTKSRNLKK
jgi:phosphoglycerol transferase MdoB-like AlkP superfamily enzyme